MTKMTDFKPPEVLNFRRDDRRESSTIITVQADYKGYAWICAGDVDVVGSSARHDPWRLESKLHGATDDEHDTAVLFRMQLVGVTLHMASGGRVWIDAFIAGDDPGSFRVPLPGWNQLEGATKCRQSGCRGKDAQHLVVANGRYIPPLNPELFNRLRGLRIEIVTGRVL